LIYEGTTNPSFGTFPNPANREEAYNQQEKQLLARLDAARGANEEEKEEV
jgi:hypothetical protein